MERKTALTVVAGITLAGLVLSVGGWYLVVDTPAVTHGELDAKSPYPPDSTAGSYTLVANASARSLTDDSDRSRWETAVRYNGTTGEKFGRLATSSPRRNLSIQVYNRYEGNATEKYARYRSSATEEFRDRVSTLRDDLDPQTEALRVDNETQTYYHYEREAGHGDLEMGEVRFGLVVLPPYERVGTATVGGREVTKYVPVTGWVDVAGSADTAPGAYVSDTAGAVYVSRSNGRIVRADVSFTAKRTERRLGRWLGSGGTRVHIRLAVTRAVDHADLRPQWVSKIDDESSTP